jgi:stage II sporulation protein AA (anti-sigma F factor antagonist)
MDIAEDKAPDALTLTLKGRLDATSSGAFEERLLKHIEAGDTRIVIDMSHLDYISSVGLRALMVGAKRVKPLGGRIVLCALQPSVKQVFDIAGFGSIFPIVASRGDATARLA